MDAAHDETILESSFAAELARQLTTAANAATREALSTPTGRRPRRWLLVVAAVAAACAAAVAGVILATSGGGTEQTSALAPSSPRSSAGAPLIAGPAPIVSGDELSGVVAGAGGRVWAWGVTHGTDKEHPGGPLLEVWDGTRWSSLSVPGNEIYGVAEPAPSDLWVAVTKRQGGRLAHWDGARWRLQAAMGFTGTSEASNVLLALSPTDVWAVGEATVAPGHPASEGRRKPWLLNRLTALHWNGTRWRSVTMPSLGRGYGEAYLRLLKGASPDSIWALGDYARYHRKMVHGKRKWVPWHDGLFLLHWDGKHWSRAPWPTSQLATSRRDAFSIDDMAVAPDGALWCEGTRFHGPDNRGDRFVPVVLRLTAGRWQIMASSTKASLPADWRAFMPSSISLTSGNDVWVAGTNAWAANPVPSYLWHWDGSSWSVTELETAQLPGRSFVSRVLALAPDDVWALCNGSTTVTQGAVRLQPSFLHFDGKVWRPVAAP
jgi:hypothetical protein